MLDAYPNQEQMKDVLGFDNEDFITYLKRKGFFLSNNNRSNYNFTKHSIPATFNLDYLPMEKIKNDIFKLNKNEFSNKKIENGQVLSCFEFLGYNNYIDSPIVGSEHFNNEFSIKLLYMTVLVSPYIQNYVSKIFFRNRVLLTLKSLEEPINIKKPMFVYKHIMIPHLPYMFDRYGNLPNIFKSTAQELFIEQVLYTNLRVKTIIDNILSNYKKRRPIIIIQGDHGPEGIFEVNDKKNILNYVQAF